MFYGYHITINRETSDIDAAYKIFFIILELISDYQLSSLLIILFSKKNTSLDVRCFFCGIKKV